MSSQPTERLLSHAVYSLLMTQSPQSAAAFLELYSDPSSADIGQQIRSLNSFWREQFGMASVNTIAVRECLSDHCTLEDWMRVFAQHVAPVAVQLQLPRQYPASTSLPGY